MVSMRKGGLRDRGAAFEISPATVDPRGVRPGWGERPRSERRITKGRADPYTQGMRAFVLALLFAACTHAPTPRPALGEAKRLWGARSGLEMSYIVRPALEGDAGTVVLLHPWGLDHRVWRRVVPDLQRRHHLVLVDLPGHGRSDKSWTPYTMPRLARAVLDVLDDVGAESAFVIGNSLGGATALEVARIAPARVERLVLLGAPGGAPMSEALTRLQRQAVTPMNLETLTPSAWRLGVWFGVRSPEARQELQDLLQEIHGAPDWPAGARSSAAVFDAVMRYHPDLSTIRTPALVVHGAGDFVVPARFSRALAEGLPNGQRVQLERCGHVPQLECPEQLMAAILGFLSETETYGDTGRLRVKPKASRGTGAPDAYLDDARYRRAHALRL